MPYDIKFDNFSSWPQSRRIPDATPHNDGVMTKEQAAKLASLTPGGLPDQTGHAGDFLQTDGMVASWQPLPSTNPLVLPFTFGAFTPTLALGAVADATWLKITSADPGPFSDFYGLWQSTPNAGGNPNDDVVSFGWIPRAGTGGTLLDRWESIFLGGHLQQERHLEWFDSFGTSTRFISFEGHVDDGSTALFIDAVQIALGSGRNSSASPSLSITPTTTTISSPIQVANGVFDSAGGAGTVTLYTIDNAFNTKSQLVLVSDGSAHLDSSSVGRLIDLRNSGNPSFQWDSSASQILSPNNQTQISVSDGSIVTFVSGAPILAVGANSFTVVKTANFNLDDVETNTRGDQVARILVRNSTVATALVAQQYSPVIVLTGHGWNGLADQPASFEMQTQPDGTGAGALAWLYSSDEANFVPVANLRSDGGFSATGGLGLWGTAAPAAQFAPTHSTAGFVANAGTPVLSGSTFTGGVGATAMTVDDVVAYIKSQGGVAL